MNGNPAAQSHSVYIEESNRYFVITLSISGSFQFNVKVTSRRSKFTSISTVLVSIELDSSDTCVPDNYTGSDSIIPPTSCSPSVNYVAF